MRRSCILINFLSTSESHRALDFFAPEAIIEFFVCSKLSYTFTITVTMAAIATITATVTVMVINVVASHIV